MSKVSEPGNDEPSYIKARKTAENSEELPDSFEMIEYRSQLYAVDIDGVPESFYDAVDTNYDPANVEAEAFVYNEALDEFKQVSDEVVNEILEGEL
jgi:hypothetical protein